MEKYQIHIKSGAGHTLTVECSPKTGSVLENNEEICTQLWNKQFLETENVDSDFILNSPLGPKDKPKATWLEKDCKLLITLYKEALPKVGKTFELSSKRKLWGYISKKMQEYGCFFSALQIEGKWKSLERSFKKKTIHNKKTGRNRIACEYEDDFKDIMLERAAIVPTYYRLGSASGSGRSQVQILHGL